MQHVVSLLAFKDARAVTEPLLRQEQRERVAGEANRAMLLAQNLRERPVLEDLSRQLVAVEEVLEEQRWRAVFRDDDSSPAAAKGGS